MIPDACFECGFRTAVEDGLCRTCAIAEERQARLVEPAAADAVRAIAEDRERARPAAKLFGFKVLPTERDRA